MFEIQTHTLAQGWINTWTLDNGEPERFDTLSDAAQALENYRVETAEYVACGYLEPSDDQYRIVGVS